MKNLFYILAIVINQLIITPQFSLAQGGAWTWVGGDTINSLQSPIGHKGLLGVPSITNWPPDMWGSAYWTGSDGNFYLFGGERDSVWPYQMQHSDMWRYEPTSGLWTWMNGPGTINSQGSFGIQGVAASSNHPPSMKVAITWTTLNTLWLFGGDGARAGAYPWNLAYDDVWKYDLTTQIWTWVKGMGIGNSLAVYGTLGIPANSNTPGARWSAASWVDTIGNLWLYGGQSTAPQSLEDLWTYNPTTNMWTWMGGSPTQTMNPVWGTLGVANSTNNPGQRSDAMGWINQQGEFLLFGGFGNSPAWNDGFNDLWKYDNTSLNWTWINGVNSAGNYGNYPNYCQVGRPCGRIYPGAWVDDGSGNAWIFGGQGPWWTAGHRENDLWYYKASTNEFIRMAGDIFDVATLTRWPIYGQLGVPSQNNKPRSLVRSAMWLNQGGSSLYLYGGYGYSSNNNQLWRFDIDTLCYQITALPNESVLSEIKMAIYPNPLTASTTLAFNLSHTKNISISILDVVGRTVQTIPTKILQSGENKITIDLTELNSGIYFCQIITVGRNQTVKLIKN